MWGVETEGQNLSILPVNLLGNSQTSQPQQPQTNPEPEASNPPEDTTTQSTPPAESNRPAAAQPAAEQRPVAAVRQGASQPAITSDREVTGRVVETLVRSESDELARARAQAENVVSELRDARLLESISTRPEVAQLGVEQQDEGETQQAKDRAATERAEAAVQETRSINTPAPESSYSRVA